ncbi:MAG: apolipoprotein N-acyltransferase [Nocardioides sp.]
MRLLARALVCAAAGMVTALGFAPLHFVYLIPVAIAAQTLACRGVRARHGFGLAAVYGVAFMLVLLPWLQVIGWYAWLVLAVLEGLFYGLVGIAAALTVRHRGWPLAVAATWVLVEALRSAVPFGGFPWGRLAFATEDSPIAPWLAWVGAAGTSFAVALVGAALAWAVLAARRTPVRSVAAVLGAGLVAVVPSLVQLPDASAALTGRTVRVAAVQGNVPGKGLEAFARRRVVLDNHVHATLQLADRIATGKGRRPDLVVWPENSSDIDPYTDPGAHAEIAAAARAVGVPLLMGAVVGDRADQGWRNRAIVWSGRGVSGATYDKIHPVPFGEYIPLRSVLAPRIPELRQIPSDMVPGHRAGVLRVGPARLGVLMCFEVAYDGLVHDVVRDGAGIIVVPTNNATYTGTGQIEQQFAMSRLRAIETGRAVVVASTNGISGIIGPDGRVIDRAQERATRVLEASVPVRSGLTPAVRFGGWVQLGLAAISFVWLTGALLVGYRRRSRPGDRTAPEGPPLP